jgi:hypothetical protein
MFTEDQVDQNLGQRLRHRTTNPMSPFQGVRRGKVRMIPWVRYPPGNWSFQPEAAEVSAEVTKP